MWLKTGSSISMKTLRKTMCSNMGYLLSQYKYEIIADIYVSEAADNTYTHTIA